MIGWIVAVQCGIIIFNDVLKGVFAMDTKQYKFVGKDFDIEAAPTKIDGYNDEDMAMIENVKG